MNIVCKIRFYFVLIFICFCSSINAAGINLIKSVNPPVGAIGDTITVCISIDPSSFTLNVKADIMWVIDTTSSMSTGIAGVKNNISSFTSQLAARGIDYRQGLENFGDIYESEAQVNRGFAANDAQFLLMVGALTLTDGGDWPESGIDAIVDAVTNTGAAVWRTDASKTIIFITDASVRSKECLNGNLSLTYTAADLASKGVVIHAVCNDVSSSHPLPSIYPLCNPKDIPPLTGGIWLDYSTSNWAAFLSTLGNQVGSYTNVVVRDPMPPELVPIDSACGATITGNELSWSFVQVGSDSIFNVCCFLARITSAFAGSISNTAYVSADGVSETASNNVYIFYPTYTSTCTITMTSTSSPTATMTSTYTVTCTKTETSTSTITSTCTPTFTVTPTLTPTPLPLNLGLKGNFPNPFADKTNIVYWLSVDAAVEIRVFTVSGELVLEKKNIAGYAGYNNFFWNALNRSEKKIASGVFIYKVIATTTRDEKATAFSKMGCVR